MDDEDAAIRRILAGTSTIAVIGASPNPTRASNYVMAYLQQRGYRCIPVNPTAAGREINGERVHASLAEIAEPVQLVDVFRNSDSAGEAVDEAIALKDRLGIAAVWLQLGVRDDAAASRARLAGLGIVMDLCIKVEYARLFGSKHRLAAGGFAP